MDNKYVENINYEISQIEEQFENFKPLLDLCKLKRLDLIETTAAWSFVHSLYNGIENILIQTFKGINEKLPDDINWHKNLLEQAFSKRDNREPLLNNSCYAKTRFWVFFHSSWNVTLAVIIEAM